MFDEPLGKNLSALDRFSDPSIFKHINRNALSYWTYKKLLRSFHTTLVHYLNMSTSSILSAIYFLGMSIHGVIYAGWAAGGAKAQMSYVVLLALGLLVCYDNLVRHI
jgi:hypothetical protein